MNKIVFISILMAVTKIDCSQSVLDVNFNVPKSGEAILTNAKTQDVDTLKIHDGLLTFNGRLNEPTLFYMVVDGYNNSRPMNLILSHEKTEIRFEEFKKVELNKEIEDLFPNKPEFIKDPNKNHVFYNYQNIWMKFYNNIIELDTSDSEELLEKRKAVYNSFLITCDSLIQSNSNAFVSTIIINHLLKENLLQPEAIQSFYDYLAPDVKESFFGIKIGEYAGKTGKLQPGNPAPEFELVDINNHSYDLGSLKGKKILLHFWASWCAPCIKDAPELISLSEENKDNTVTINISLDTDEDNWKKGIERAGIGKMNNTCDFKASESKVVQDYAVNVVPTYYLIDEKGIIILKGSLNQVSEEIKKL